jgi:hypothetical protein
MVWGFLIGLLIGALLLILSRSDTDDNDDNDDDFEEGCRVAFIHRTMDDFL